jgi:hypothetical protein
MNEFTTWSLRARHAWLCSVCVAHLFCVVEVIQLIHGIRCLLTHYIQPDMSTGLRGGLTPGLGQTYKHALPLALSIHDDDNDDDHDDADDSKCP